ncbi:hypothetical protein SLH46_12420 [Draconibacterium sp. IB214405]|uniref:hypothetical protein n=1 Tax=Draconibacterium sp. IB214405 TaxID=3097352 RepID=UPI002A17422A|nr:hypothetical protein [Draconibacterium sp. IB214405]MDX8339996.1 hypothetical protein [Draconibacterium sp. IB214405]
MKKLAFFSILLTTLCFISCNSSDKSKEVASYTYEEKKVEMSDELKAKIPDWVEEGKICYGIVVQVTEDQKPVKGKPIKAKVVLIGENSVKMKALETVSLVEVQGCSKMGITKGETWDEDEGDLYLSLDEAIAALKEMKIYASGDKVTVD